MRISTRKSPLLTPRSHTVEQLLDSCLENLDEKSVVAMSSKAIALCQGRVADKTSTIKEEVIKTEADKFMPIDFGEYAFHFTITNNTFIPSAGVDESNAADTYVLWPAEPQKVANQIRKYLKQKFNLNHVGVIITDSNSMPPLRRGTIGIMLAHSGFLATKNEVGEPDLFGKKFRFSHAGIGSGLAAAADVVMGQGRQQTPVAVITDLDFVEFQDRNPTDEELAIAYVPLEDDLYSPFLASADWQEGGHGMSNAKLEDN